MNEKEATRVEVSTLMLTGLAVARKTLMLTPREDHILNLCAAAAVLGHTERIPLDIQNKVANMILHSAEAAGYYSPKEAGEIITRGVEAHEKAKAQPNAPLP